MNVYTNCKICSSRTEVVNQKYDLVRCTSCKLVFCNKIFSDEDIVNVYDKLYNKTDQYKIHIKESENLISKKNRKIGKTKRFVLNYLLKNNPNKILELGAGVGVVANYLKTENVDYTGIELDKKTVERAKKTGVNIIQGDFKSISNLQNNFDVVVAFEVIEHLQELNELFKIVYKKLNSNGYFGLTVPNYDKRLNYKNKTEIYQSKPPIHLNFFTLESFQNISSLYGFKIVISKEKRFPYFNWKKIDTYKFIIKSLFGKYRGSTLIVILQKDE